MYPSATQKGRNTAIQEWQQNCFLSQLVAKDYFCKAVCSCRGSLRWLWVQINRVSGKTISENCWHQISAHTAGYVFVQETLDMQNLTSWPPGFPQGLQGLLVHLTTSALPCVTLRWCSGPGVEVTVTHIATDVCTSTSVVHYSSYYHLRWNCMLAIFLTNKQQVMNGHKQNEILREKLDDP